MFITGGSAARQDLRGSDPNRVQRSAGGVPVQGKDAADGGRSPGTLFSAVARLTLMK